MDDGLIYLEDLRVGQRFTTGEYALDAEEITAFARQYDPQPFHTDQEAARPTASSAAWWPAAGTRPASPCGWSWRASRSRAG